MGGKRDDEKMMERAKCKFVSIFSWEVGWIFDISQMWNWCHLADLHLQALNSKANRLISSFQHKI